MNVLNDILKFFNYLSFVDIIFLIAVLMLLILLVTLLYFVRINKEVLTSDDLFPPMDNKVESSEMKEEKIKLPDGNVYKIESSPKKEVEEYNDEEAELIDLEGLTKKLKEEEQNNRVNFTEYEKDQEEKAIISYDELLKRSNSYAINYEKEEVLDDLIVKKVNLNDLVNREIEIPKEKEEVRVISYSHEEAFLNALKELNSLLN